MSESVNNPISEPPANRPEALQQIKALRTKLTEDGESSKLQAIIAGIPNTKEGRFRHARLAVFRYQLAERLPEAVRVHWKRSSKSCKWGYREQQGGTKDDLQQEVFTAIYSWVVSESVSAQRQKEAFAEVWTCFKMIVDLLVCEIMRPFKELGCVKEKPVKELGCVKEKPHTGRSCKTAWLQPQQKIDGPDWFATNCPAPDLVPEPQKRWSEAWRNVIRDYEQQIEDRLISGICDPFYCYYVGDMSEREMEPVLAKYNENLAKHKKKAITFSELEEKLETKRTSLRKQEKRRQSIIRLGQRDTILFDDPGYEIEPSEGDRD